MITREKRSTKHFVRLVVRYKATLRKPQTIVPATIAEGGTQLEKMAPRDGPANGRREQQTQYEDEQSVVPPVPPGEFRLYPTNRDVFLKSSDSWIKGKRIDDDIGSYWRVHNKLYDLSQFIDKHPGGKDWLRFTRGTDITEAFESIHTSSAAEKILPKYFVKDCSTPRNSPYTFHEDGFYKTLKRKAQPILQRIGKGPTLKMLVLQDGLMLTFVSLATAAALTHSYIIVMFAGIALGLTCGCAHNFIHMRDNIRMYYFDLTFFSSFEWRITHVISHHNYPNTWYDYEVSVFEPFWEFMPKPNKHFIQRYCSYFYENLLIPFALYFEALKRFYLVFTSQVPLRPENLLPVLELVVMSYLAPSAWDGFKLWIAMHCSCSTWYMLMSLAGTHHHPDIYHALDAARENPDWGLCQLDAIRDKIGVVGNLFLVATTFGDHGLHHLFPTVDHSKLNELYPIFFDTCREFQVQREFWTQWELIRGKYMQMSNITPNLCPPGVAAKTE